MNRKPPDHSVAAPHTAATEQLLGRRAGVSGRVLVTRSLAQSSKLAGELEVRGLTPIVIPALEFAEPHSFAPLDTALSELERFHWLLFTSANAVKVFAERCGRVSQAVATNQQDTAADGERRRKALDSAGSRNRIAAIGAGTAQALRAHGFAVDLLPEQAVAESLADALLPYAHQVDGTATRFLLVRAEETREILPETLRAAGSEVVVAPAYRTRVPSLSVGAVCDLFSRPEQVPDAITFTSASTVRNLLALCEAAPVRMPAAAIYVSIGPITSAALRESGLRVDAEAREATVASLAETTGKALRERLEGFS